MNRKLTVSIFAGLAVVVATPALVYLTPLSAENARYESALVKVRALGVPMSDAEFDRSASISPTENAATLLNKISFLKSNDPVLKDNWDGLQQPMRPMIDGDTKPLEIRIAVLSRPIKLIERAAECPRLAFPRNWSKVASVGMPEFNDLREVLRVLMIQSRLAIRKGQREKAVPPLIAAAKLVHLMQDEPNIPSLLARLSGEQMVLGTMTRFLDKFAKTVDVDEDCRKILSALGPLSSLKDTYRGEMFWAMRQMRQAQAGKVSTTELLGIKADEGIPSLTGQQQLIALRLKVPKFRSGIYADVAERFLKTYELLPESEAVNRSTIKALEDLDSRLDRNPDGNALLSKFLVMPFEGSATSLGECLAYRRVIRTALEGFRIRRTTGRYPSALPASGTEGQDPFGTTLRYRLEKGGMVIYSVARDGQDDGGVPRNRFDGSPRYDIVYRSPEAQLPMGFPRPTKGFGEMPPHRPAPPIR